MLLQMVVGGIINIDENRDFISGCPTCDYGSSYINYIDIELTKLKIHIHISKMYSYLLTEGYMMKVLLQNVDEIKLMSEQEFCEWLEKQIKNDYEDDSEFIEFEVNEIN